MDITTLARLAKITESAETKISDAGEKLALLSETLGETANTTIATSTGAIDAAVVDLQNTSANLGGISQIMKEEVFTSNTTWDWNAAGQPKCVWVTLYGSGAGGGNGTHASGGGGGGSGFYCKDRYFTVSGNVSVTVGADVNEHTNGQTTAFGGYVSVQGGYHGANQDYSNDHPSHKGWAGGWGGNSGGAGGGRHHNYRGNNGNTENGSGEGAGGGGPSGDHPSSHGSGGGGGGGGLCIDGHSAEPGHGHSHHHRGAGGGGGSGYGGGGGGGAQHTAGNGGRGICIVKYWVDPTTFTDWARN